MAKKNKIGRNDPCPCGSRKKYKKCCLGKTSEEIEEKKQENEFMERSAKKLKAVYRKANKDKRVKHCIHPKQTECSERIIKAHSIQNNKILKNISTDGKLITVVNRDIADCFQPFNVQGRALTSIFTGFCSYHDKTLFQPIEDQDFQGTVEQIFLHIYRAFAFQYHRKIEELKMQQIIMNEISGEHSGPNELMTGIEYAIKDFLDDKQIFDKAILDEDFDCLTSFLWEFDGPLYFAASVFFTPIYGMDHKKMADLTDPTVKASHIYFSVFPEKGRSYAIIAWLNEDSERLKSFETGLSEIPIINRKRFLNRIIAESTENLAINPECWEQWNPQEKHAFEEFYQSSNFYYMFELPMSDYFEDLGFDLFNLSPHA